MFAVQCRCGKLVGLTGNSGKCPQCGGSVNRPRHNRSPKEPHSATPPPEPATPTPTPIPTPTSTTKATGPQTKDGRPLRCPNCRATEIKIESHAPALHRWMIRCTKCNFSGTDDWFGGKEDFE